MAIQEKEYMGINDWVWWFGVVEDVNDPMEIGRIKVRVFGYQNQDKNAVPTQSLPWCYQIMPTTSASHDTHGASPTGLNVGSWVVGWFMDGRKGQFPIIFGTIHGVHASALGIGGLPGAGGAGGGPTGGWPAPGSQSPSSPGGGDGLVPPTGSGRAPTGSAADLGLAPAQGTQTMDALGINAAQWDAYRAGLASLESNRYNQTGGYKGAYSGRYQFGRNEIRETARRLGETPPTRSQFLNDPGMQERYLDAYTASHHEYLMANSPQYRALGTVEKMGVLGYAHNQGAGWGRGKVVGATKWLATGQVGVDGFGTSGNKYYDQVVANMNTVTNTADSPFDQDTINEAFEGNESEIDPTEYNTNETACSADSLAKRAHSHHFPTWTQCQDDTPMTNQSNDKVQELDTTEGQYMETWPQGGDQAMAGTPVPKDVGSYPKEQVWTSPGGKVMMGWDDTPGASRYWALMPETGNRVEWDDVGNVTTHASGSYMKITNNNSREYTKGDHTITSDHDVKVLSQHETTIQSKQGINMSSARGFTLQTDGALNIVAGGPVTFQGSSIQMMASEGSLDMRSADEVTLESKGEMSLNAGTSSDKGSEGGVSIDTAGPMTIAAPGIAIAADSKIKMEAPDMSFKGPNIKLDVLTVNKAWVDILNWDKTVSSSKYSKYADEAIVTKNMGGNAQPSSQKDGDSEQQTRLDSAKSDPPYEGEKKSGKYGTSIATRQNEAKSVTDGGGRKGGKRNQGSGGRGAAPHSNANPMPKGVNNQAGRVDTPEYRGDKAVPTTTDLLRSDGSELYGDQIVVDGFTDGLGPINVEQ